MRRTTALAAAVVVASLLAVPVVGAAATGGDPVAQTDNETNETNATVSPGERLSGVVGVQGAELEGEVEERAFGLKVARAKTPNATADIVDAQLKDLEQRLDELQQRKEALKQARKNGSISDGAYRAKMAELVARGQTVKKLANETNETASKLPAEVLRANGVNVTAIQTLKNNAQNLTGPEVAAIARSIAGPGAAVPGIGGGPPEGIPGGPPEGVPGGNTTGGQGGVPGSNTTGGPDGAPGGNTTGTPGGPDGAPGGPGGNTTGTDTPDGNATGTDTRSGGR